MLSVFYSEIFIKDFKKSTFKGRICLQEGTFLVGPISIAKTFNLFDTKLYPLLNSISYLLM